MSREQLADIVVKAVVAAGFFFALEFYALKATLEMSLAWAASMGVAAAVLAYTQHRRGL